MDGCNIWHQREMECMFRSFMDDRSSIINAADFAFFGSLAVARKLGDDSLTKCQESTLADNEFISIYLGYFFVALSVPDDVTMLFLYGIIFIFTFLSQTQYFNPLYLLFGYHYYHVLTAQGTRVFVIARGKVIRNPLYMSFIRFKRVNDTTYLSIGEDIQ